MTVAEKEGYLKKLEQDYACNSGLIEPEIEASIANAGSPDELAEWSEALWNRCFEMREMNGMYANWAERLDENYAG